MIGASWKSDLSIQGIGWPPELSAKLKSEDNEGILPEITGNARPKG